MPQTNTISVPLSISQIVGQFIARAVADDCLPPAYVTSYKGKVESPCIRAALEKAEVLLSMNHGMVRLDSVWGIGGGNRPVRYLTNRVGVFVATRCRDVVRGKLLTFLSRESKYSFLGQK